MTEATGPSGRSREQGSTTPGRGGRGTARGLLRADLGRLIGDLPGVRSPRGGRARPTVPNLPETDPALPGWSCSWGWVSPGSAARLWLIRTLREPAAPRPRSWRRGPGPMPRPSRAAPGGRWITWTRTSMPSSSSRRSARLLGREAVLAGAPVDLGGSSRAASIGRSIESQLTRREHQVLQGGGEGLSRPGRSPVISAFLRGPGRVHLGPISTASWGERRGGRRDRGGAIGLVTVSTPKAVVRRR